MRTAAPVTPVLFATPILLPRAVALWALTRLAVAILPLAIGDPIGSLSPSAPGMVLLCGAVGLVDVRIRRERILWANLGVPAMILFGIYAAAAGMSETLLAFLLR